MRVLVLGGRGMLGRALVAVLRQRGDAVLGIDVAEADVRDAEALAFWAKSFRPEWIVNCAAFTRVDACESERDLAFAINGEAVGNMTRVAGAVGAALLQVSTDYVFAGDASTPYTEEAPAGPRSVYGQSKLRGEEWALAFPESLVVRTSWLFGEHGPNFVDTIVGLLEAGEQRLRVVDDQVGAPTHAPALARALVALMARGARGLVHCQGREAVSWYEFARAIVTLWRPGVPVVPVKTSEMPRPAPRPAFSVLDVSRCEALLGRPVEPWLHGLWQHLEEQRSARRE